MMENKKPLHILYNTNVMIDTLLAYINGTTNTSASEIKYVPLNTYDEINKEVDVLFESRDDVNYVAINQVITKDDMVEHHYEDDALKMPRVLHILLGGSSPEYWSLNEAWNFVEHDLSTEDGFAFVKALMESKAYGTETQDPSQQWNALWQMINMGNIICLTLASVYRRGVKDDTPFYNFIKQADKAADATSA